MKNRIIILIIAVVLVLLLLIYKFTVNKPEEETNTVDQLELLYTIYSDRVDCLAPRLKLYDNMTYEYNGTYGSYSYDIEDIINNSSKYEINDHGVYILKDSDNNSFKIYDSNKEFNEFISSIGVDLDICDDFG